MPPPPPQGAVSQWHPARDGAYESPYPANSLAAYYAFPPSMPRPVRGGAKRDFKSQIAHRLPPPPPPLAQIMPPSPSPVGPAPVGPDVPPPTPLLAQDMQHQPPPPPPPPPLSARDTQPPITIYPDRYSPSPPSSSSDDELDDDLEPMPFSPTIIDDIIPRVQSVSADGGAGASSVSSATGVSVHTTVKPSPFRVSSYSITHSSFTNVDPEGTDIVAQITTIGQETTLTPTECKMFKWMYVGPLH